MTAIFVRRIEKKNIAIEDALKKSEKRYRELAENIPDLITRFDLNLRFLYGNQAVMNRTGLSYGAHIGKTAREYGSTSAEPWEKTAREVIRTGEVKRVVVTSDINQEMKIYDIFIIPEKDENDNVSSVISIARDITSMKEAENNLQQQAIKLEESEKRFRELVKHAPTAIYEIDFKKKKFITVNDAMCSMSGYSREELLSMNIFDLLDDESKSKFTCKNQ